MPTYEQTLDYLFSRLPMFTRIGAAALKPNLDNITELCRLLNNPQHSFKSIHIAGTNGKGSTSHMLASVMQESGYTTGLYTSPHLLDFRERIRVNGVCIPKDFVIDFVQRTQSLFEPIQASFFEYTQALCFDYFRHKKIDIAIIETGLGGRLDSTNIISPELSIITHIAFDHTDLLGKTMAEIAFEKAGIIKAKTPVLIGRKQVEVESVFLQKAIQEQSPIYFAEDLVTVHSFQSNGMHSKSIMLTQSAITLEINCPLAGIYQEENIRTVIAATELLKQGSFTITPATTLLGLERVIQNTHLMGRWQTLALYPQTVCDTGHNEEGIEQILTQLKNINYAQLHMVMGMVKDKNIDAVLAMLPKEASYYWCKANLPRAMEANELANKAEQMGITGLVCSSVSDAVKQAQSKAQKEDFIFIGGSTFVVAEAIPLFLSNNDA